MGNTKAKDGHFKATTVVLKWNGKEYRVAKDIAEAIKKRKDYSAEAPKGKKSPKAEAPKKDSIDKTASKK